MKGERGDCGDKTLGWSARRGGAGRVHVGVCGVVAVVVAWWYVGCGVEVGVGVCGVMMGVEGRRVVGRVRRGRACGHCGRSRWHSALAKGLRASRVEGGRLK